MRRSKYWRCRRRHLSPNGPIDIASCFSMKIAIVTLFTEEIADYGAIGARISRPMGGVTATIVLSIANGWTRVAIQLVQACSDQKAFAGLRLGVWTDADSLVMNGEQTLEAIIAKQENKDMILTWEAGASPVNTGQWLIRNTQWSSATLSAIEDPACSNSRPKWFEQGALIEWLKADERRWTFGPPPSSSHELHAAGCAVRTYRCAGHASGAAISLFISGPLREGKRRSST